MIFESVARVLESEELTDDLAELGKLLSCLPAPDRARAESLYARVLESNRKRRRLLSMVQQSISELRLDLKYLEFDLEATRRERDDCLRLLAEEEDFDQDGELGIEGEMDD